MEILVPFQLLVKASEWEEEGIFAICGSRKKALMQPSNSIQLTKYDIK